MVPADSDRASPTPPYSGYHYSITSYVYRTVTFYGLIFQKILLQCYVHVWSYNPLTPRCQGLGCSAFARHYLRNHNCFLFLRVLRCFSSPGSPPYGFQVFNLEGYPIRKSADRSLYAAPRSLSQLTTSFLVSESQGIHHAPLFTSYSLVDNRIILLSTKYLQTLFSSLIQPFKELFSSSIKA